MVPRVISGEKCIANGVVTYANGQMEPIERPAVDVAANLVDPAGGYWGPTLRLTPSIKTAGDRLLGTDDFFEIFEVSFWPGGATSRLSLVV